MVNSKKFEQLTNYELWQIAILRTRVFTIEQKIIEEELEEEQDYNAMHYFIACDNKIVAYARVIVVDGKTKVGRVCTDPNYRKQGYQTAIMKAILQQSNEATVSAQIQVAGFYEKLGFEPIGGTYLEAGIVHQKMIFKKL